MVLEGPPRLSIFYKNGKGVAIETPTQEATAWYIKDGKVSLTHVGKEPPPRTLISIRFCRKRMNEVVAFETPYL